MGRRTTLEQLRFDNQALECLPVDQFLRQGVSCEPIGRDESQDSLRCTHPRHCIPRACYSLARATPLAHPTLVAASPYTLSLLQLEPKQALRPEFVEIFSGNRLLPGMRPAAHNYAGHQFGSFSGQLGDGACLYLGEIMQSEHSGVAGPRLELQIKGAGKTPYSRGGDGRKVLPAVVREFLACEAMHHLGVPTVRAVACISSSTAAVRDYFYSGENAEQRCGVLVRAAASFMRIGSFEIFRSKDPLTGQAGPSAGLALKDVEVGVAARSSAKLLPAMIKHVVVSQFPECEERVQRTLQEEGMTNADATSEARACLLRAQVLLREVVCRTAALVAQWESLGFCHGLLNTDNISIVGLTLDYGAFAFMERYDPSYCPCITDDANRYSFEAQKEVCKWNCFKLAEAFAPVLPQEQGEAIVATDFDSEYSRAWLRRHRSKLGLQRVIDLQDKLQKCEETGDVEGGAAARKALHDMAASDDEDRALIDDLLRLMYESGADFTLTFRALERIDDLHSTACIDRFLEWFLPTLPAPEASAAPLTNHMPVEQMERLLLLSEDNPAILELLGIPTNALARSMERMLHVHQIKAQSAAVKREEDREKWEAWAKRYWYRLLKDVVHDKADTGPSLGAPRGTDKGSSTGTGSTGGAEAKVKASAAAFAQMGRLRTRAMRASNPHTILRQYMLEIASDRASKQDFTEAQRLLHLMADPYGSDLEIELAFDYDRKMAGSSANPQPCLATLKWLNFRVLPPRETLTILLPGFAVLGSAAGESAGEGEEGTSAHGSDDRRYPLQTQGATTEAVEAYWLAARSALLLVVKKELGTGQTIALEIPRAAGLCVPPDGRILAAAREEWVPPPPSRPEWYQLTVAEEYRGLSPAWASSIVLSASS